MIIRLGDRELRVYRLVTPSDQAQGFQFYERIPKHFGYFFLGAGKNLFHMHNVPGHLLMVALDAGYKVVGKEIRQPESSARLVAGGKGTHILELHPDYDTWIEVGKKI